MEQTIPKLLRRIASEHPDLPAQYSKEPSGEFSPVLYKELYSTVLDFAAGLLAIGNARADHIGLIADNRKEWFQSSLGIMAIGAADVPRGCDANAKDIAYILSFSECKTAILENDAQIRKVLEHRETLSLLKTLIVFDAPDQALSAEVSAAGYTLFGYTEILEKGRAFRAAQAGRVEQELESGTGSELATIIFTSGTTGEPKGVMLSHTNFTCQLDDLLTRLVLHPGDRALSVLPVWHSFERTCEYVILAGATAIVYSKPVGSILLADLAKMNPHLLPSVPRIWESVYDGIFRAMRKKGGVSWVLFSFFVSVSIIHARAARSVLLNGPITSVRQMILSPIFGFIPFILLFPLKALGGLLVFKKIRAKLGTSFRVGVSGGGALPPNVDEFFWAVGVNVIEGYGLTETAPVVAVRNSLKPVFGTIGTTIDCCEVRIVDEQRQEVGPGVKGTVLVKGSNVMQGYYRKPDLTAKVIGPDGWFDTGDLGFKTLRGEIVLRGRKKDTIVLRGGENIEPVPIEMKINESRYVSQSVVLGQDQRYLAALVVVNKDELVAWAQENSIDTADFNVLLDNPLVRKLYEAEIAELVSQKNGFRLFERINKFILLGKPFEVGVELSAKQEIMHYRMEDLYRKEVTQLFS